MLPAFYAKRKSVGYGGGGGGGAITDEPTFREGIDNTVLPDGATIQTFDSFADINAVHSAGYALKDRTTPNMYALVAGRGGSGQALRGRFLNATGAGTYPMLEPYLTGIGNAATTNIQDLVISFYMRLSVGADPTWGGTSGDGMKFLVVWRNSTLTPGVIRITNGVGSGDLVGTRNSYSRTSLGGISFASRDNDFSTADHAWIQKQPGDPRWGNFGGDTSPASVVLNDGNWHRFTGRYINGSGAGRVLNWIDGSLELDTADADDPTYATAATGFHRMELMGTPVVMPVPLAYEFDFDIDDFQMWEIP